MQYITDPMTIETRSMEIIAPYLADKSLSEQEIKVVSRIIHAAGDPDYGNVVVIHPGAIEAGCTGLLSIRTLKWFAPVSTAAG